jgi:hypothetical protein
MEDDLAISLVIRAMYKNKHINSYKRYLLYTNELFSVEFVCFLNKNSD